MAKKSKKKEDETKKVVAKCDHLQSLKFSSTLPYASKNTPPLPRADGKGGVFDIGM